MSAATHRPPHRPLRHHAAILFVALALAAMLGWSGVGAWAERSLAPLRFASARHPASGRVVIVEMDAASVAAIHEWPWSRTHHAAVVDRLHAAGAARIAFDAEFSSASTLGGDTAFAAAIERAGGSVVLPTFAQAAGSGDRRTVDALPLPALRQHAALASVSIAPDADGIVREGVYGTVTADTPRPSLSAMLADRSGAADSFFPIAFDIDPATIPRLSYVAVRDGRFDPAAVRGRDVLIGATAVEMGDRYAVPLWGVVPGVVIQALATETLLAGTPGTGSALPLLLAALAVGAAMLAARRLPVALAIATAGVALLFAGAVWMQLRLALTLPVVPAMALVAFVALGRVALHLHARFDAQRATDDATGLPNRRAMLRTDTAMPGAATAVVVLANLEPLLAVLGEAAERDLVLRLAERLRAAAGDSTVYRLSDRLLAFTVTEAGDLDVLPARLRAVMLKPVEVQGRRLDPAIHLGIVEGAVTGDRLTMAAQAAEEAAASGVFWQDGATDRAALERRVSLMGELDHAIAAGEIEVHYQPKLSLAEDRITSAEALVRWRHPTRGMIPPDLFIPLAEQADRIGPLTHHVLAQVVHDIAYWRDTGRPLAAAVNVSAKLVADPEFGEALRRVLATGGIDPRDLTLEVTESAALSDPERAAAALRDYRALGCGVSMDDYGTGQSTLSYLQRLPLSEVKIDRSFVQHAHETAADGLMVRSTIDLAHGLGLKVVAEGIEDAGCLAFLRQAGCDMAQGYHIARPMPRDALTAMLAERSLAA